MNQSELPECMHGKRKGPEKIPSRKETFAGDQLFTDQSLLYTLWIILQKDSDIKNISSWTGFFINLNKNLAVKPSSIGYLDCLNPLATEMSTIYFMMERLIRIKDQLKLKLIVCVYDQAIYAKVYEIKCKYPIKFKEMFLIMGTFHIILTFLAVTASSFKDPGLRDILIQSNIVAEGSVDTMFSGLRAYKRAIRVYKIIYEAISRLLLKEFEAAHPDSTAAMQKYLESVTEESDFNIIISSEELSKYCNDLLCFNDKQKRVCLQSFGSAF